MFKELKLDFNGLLAINIFVTFALVIVISAAFKVTVDADLKQVLITIVTLMVGYYFGSSTGSKSKDEALIKSATTPNGELK